MSKSLEKFVQTIYIVLFFVRFYWTIVFFLLNDTIVKKNLFVLKNFVRSEKHYPRLDMLSDNIILVYSIKTRKDPATVYTGWYFRDDWTHIDSVLDKVNFEVSQRLGLWFYRSNSLILFCSPFHVQFSNVKHSLLALVLKKVIGKILIDFCLRACDL